MRRLRLAGWSDSACACSVDVTGAAGSDALEDAIGIGGVVLPASDGATTGNGGGNLEGAPTGAKAGGGAAAAGAVKSGGGVGGAAADSPIIPAGAAAGVLGFNLNFPPSVAGVAEAAAGAGVAGVDSGKIGDTFAGMPSDGIAAGAGISAIGGVAGAAGLAESGLPRGFRRIREDPPAAPSGSGAGEPGETGGMVDGAGTTSGIPAGAVDAGGTKGEFGPVGAFVGEGSVRGCSGAGAAGDIPGCGTSVVFAGSEELEAGDSGAMRGLKRIFAGGGC